MRKSWLLLLLTATLFGCKHPTEPTPAIHLVPPTIFTVTAVDFGTVPIWREKDSTIQITLLDTTRQVTNVNIVGSGFILISAISPIGWNGKVTIGYYPTEANAISGKVIILSGTDTVGRIMLSGTVGAFEHRVGDVYNYLVDGTREDDTLVTFPIVDTSICDTAHLRNRLDFRSGVRSFSYFIEPNGDWKYEGSFFCLEVPLESKRIDYAHTETSDPFYGTYRSNRDCRPVGDSIVLLNGSMQSTERYLASASLFIEQSKGYGDGAESDEFLYLRSVGMFAAHSHSEHSVGTGSPEIYKHSNKILVGWSFIP